MPVAPTIMTWACNSVSSTHAPEWTTMILRVVGGPNFDRLTFGLRTIQVSTWSVPVFFLLQNGLSLRSASVVSAKILALRVGQMRSCCWMMWTPVRSLQSFCTWTTILSAAGTRLTARAAGTRLLSMAGKAINLAWALIRRRHFAVG